jgi:uncharacterized protein involved in exopolysaccharide biosynthesis
MLQEIEQLREERNAVEAAAHDEATALRASLQEKEGELASEEDRVCALRDYSQKLINQLESSKARCQTVSDVHACF